MKKKPKRAVLWLLSFVLVLGCLAGCGNQQPASSSSAAPAASSEASSEAPAQSQAESSSAQEEAAPAPEGTVLSEVGELPIVKEGDNVITIGVMQSSNCTDYDDNYYTKWVEEQTGVDLEFVYFSSDTDEATTQLNLMIASGDKLPDILYAMVGFDKPLMYELGEDGYLIDLNDYMEDYGYYMWEQLKEVDEADQKRIFEFGTDPNNGAFYAYPRYMDLNVDAVPSMSMINMKWLEAIGEEIPTTVEELRTVLDKFASEDPNGNGEKDELAIFGFSGGYRTEIVQYIINAFVYCNKNYVFNATDGEVWNPYVTDEYRQSLVYMNELYADGLLSPMYYTLSEDSELKALLCPADGVYKIGVAAAHPSLHVEMDSTVVDDYRPLPPLKGATPLGGYSALNSAEFVYYSFITSDCENPVLAFRLLDFMGSAESWKRIRWGIYGEDWEDAQEGDTTILGVPVEVHVLNANAYGEQNNHMWHGQGSAILTTGMWSNGASKEETWATRRSRLTYGIFQAYLDGARPDEVIYDLIYSGDELTTVKSLSTQLKDYIAEAQGLFITGVMDPKNDADWNTYLANLEAQGMGKWQEIAQTAYTRMKEG